MSTTHRISTDELDDVRGMWECSCGRSGSAAAWKVDLASDRHIDYAAGDQRVDVRHSTGGERW